LENLEENQAEQPENADGHAYFGDSEGCLAEPM
jgi:hypothetical protein